MAQSSGPISQGTDAERQFSDVVWRDLFGDEPGVYGDTNGTAYNLTLPTGSNTATVGSTSLVSTARVSGFAHRIPQSQPEPIDIPDAVSVARTDIIGLRYDPTYTGAPGPVRLVRIAGTSSAIPAYNDDTTGIEDLPLWAVTRAPGQSLSQATKVKMAPRIGPSMLLETAAALPTNSPLGSRLRRGTAEYIRQLDGSNNAVWTQTNTVAADPTPVEPALGSGFEDWGFGYRNLCYWREGRTVSVAGTVRLLASMAPQTTRLIATLPTGFRPSATVSSDGITTYARSEVLSNGQVRFNNDTYGVTLQAGTLVSVNIDFPAA